MCLPSESPMCSFRLSHGHASIWHLGLLSRLREVCFLMWKFRRRVCLLACLLHFNKRVRIPCRIGNSGLMWSEGLSGLARRLVGYQHWFFKSFFLLSFFYLLPFVNRLYFFCSFCFLLYLTILEERGEILPIACEEIGLGWPCVRCLTQWYGTRHDASICM